MPLFYLLPNGTIVNLARVFSMKIIAMEAQADHPFTLRLCNGLNVAFAIDVPFRTKEAAYAEIDNIKTFCAKYKEE